MRNNEFGGADQMTEALFVEASGSAALGSVTVNSLGYPVPYLRRILSRHSLDGCTTISAHAPSLIHLKLHKNAIIHGFLNCSARFRPGNSVDFWVDGNWLGNASGPGDRTGEVELPKGDHLALAHCRNELEDFRHSIWAIKPTPVRPENPTKIATPSNTAVLTLGCYPAEKIPDALTPMAHSARKQHIWLHVLGVGEIYQSFNTKVQSMRRWIDALDDRFQFVLYVDGRDTLFIRSMAEICNEFNAIGAQIVISAECVCFPIREKAWTERFPEHPTNRRWINAGIWMGRRQAIVNALSNLGALNAQLGAAAATPQLEDVWMYREARQRDQFLWQVAKLKGLFNLKVDHKARIAANIGASARSLRANKDFSFDNGQVVVKMTGARPGILHFSGTAANHCRDQWAGFLHAL